MQLHKWSYKLFHFLCRWQFVAAITIDLHQASPLSLLSVMVERQLVLISFSWLKLLSLSHEVIGRIKAIWSKTCKFGSCKSLQACKESTNMLGRSDLLNCFHFLIHALYSVDNMTEWGKSSCKVLLPELTLLEGYLHWCTHLEGDKADPVLYHELDYQQIYSEAHKLHVRGIRGTEYSKIILWIGYLRIASVHLAANYSWSTKFQVVPMQLLP